MKEMTKSYAINRIAELEQENAELKQTLQEIKECLKDWEKAYTSFGFCEYENILNKMKDLLESYEGSLCDFLLWMISFSATLGIIIVIQKMMNQ